MRQRQPCRCPVGECDCESGCDGYVYLSDGVNVEEVECDCRCHGYPDVFPQVHEREGSFSEER